MEYRAVLNCTGVLRRKLGNALRGLIRPRRASALRPNTAYCPPVQLRARPHKPADDAVDPADTQDNDNTIAGRQVPHEGRIR